MPKRLLIGLILCLATLAGLYQLRIQLLTMVFNAALAKTDIRLLQLQGLELGWDDLNIEQLVLGVGEDNARQTLQRVHLAYSLFDAGPNVLTVRRAVLTQPVSADPSAETQLLLTGLAEQVITAPLQSITVDALEVSGFSSPLISPPLRLQATWEDEHFLLAAEDRDKQLLLRLKRTAADRLVLTANLTRQDQPVLQLSATFVHQQGQQQVQGEGRLSVDALLTLLAPLVDLPAPVTAASGDLVFQWSGLLKDDLAQLAQQQWRLQIMPETALGVKLATTDELALDVDLRLSFPHFLTIAVQARTAEGFAVTLTGEAIAWKLDEQRYSVNADGQLSTINCQYQVTLRCQTTLELQLQAPQLTLTGEGGATVKNLKLQLSTQLDLDDDRLTASLAAGELLRAESLLLGDVVASGPALIADSAGTVEYHLSSGQLRLQMDQLQLMLPRVQMPELNLATRLNLSGLELSRDSNSTLKGQLHLGADTINLQRSGAWLPALAIQSDIVLAGQAVSLTGQVWGDSQKPLFKGSADYRLDTERGSGRILADTIAFDADHNRLSQHFAHWPFEWDIFAGSLLLDVGLRWHSGEQGTVLQSEISLRLQGLAGVYQAIGFVGLDGDLAAEFHSPDQLITSSAATISLDSLDVGVPIEAIQARFLVDAAQQQLILETVEARLFGGRVWIEDAVYRVDNAHNQIPIGVDGIQVEQLLALAGYHAVEGTGLISGLLPLDVTRLGVTMERGMLAAKAPGGVFRYRTEVVADTNPAMVQVIEALSNFHYTIFQVEADYLENGDLVLEMVLRGSNPALQQGRPIHLNLNVTDNIPTLLKSLQSGRVIADTISKKLGGSSGEAVRE
ncbi:MAG: YdbH domain-containing protein [Gammaproteobacteria bacterium]|nr:YdbH domain-containing protein [Gammaproteobacteria bacterium]